MILDYLGRIFLALIFPLFLLSVSFPLPDLTSAVLDSLILTAAIPHTVPQAMANYSTRP